MIRLVQETAQTLVKELNVCEQGWADDLLGVGYCVDSTERTNWRRVGWVDDQLGIEYCADS